MNKINKNLIGLNVLIIILNLWAMYRIEQDKKLKEKNKGVIKRYDIEIDDCGLDSLSKINKDSIDIYICRVVKIDTNNYIGRIDYYKGKLKINERMILIDENYALYVHYYNDSIKKYYICKYKMHLYKGRFSTFKYGYDEQHPDCYW